MNIDCGDGLGSRWAGIAANREWLHLVLGYLYEHRNEGFSGLGLVFYKPPMVLPVIDLAVDVAGNFFQRNSRESAEYLRCLADIGSPNHDGFHLIDVTTMQITHVSQFFSPPIAKAARSVANVDGPIGARYMAAFLGSLLPSVDLTAILGRSEEAIFFRQGQVLRLEEK